ncbi:MAG TPA: HAD family hydrolase [Lachnospiraceae bacterium]|nr:HAD family hydrolase [Lachnospiraceae bacterium]
MNVGERRNKEKMALEMVMFDLDGTLLPMDMDEFTGGYFKMLAKKLEPYGYELDSLVKSIWHGTAAMVRNDGSCSNEEAFWKDFAGTYGERALKDKVLFDEFYANEFDRARQFCGFEQKAAETVKWIKACGLRTALATNPLFPSVATETRIRWAGLEPDDFEFITTYENISFCKPNPDYYREVLKRAGMKAESCLMVGNDVGEDMVAANLGMKVFLLTDCLINKFGEDIDKYPHGGFDDLRNYLQQISHTVYPQGNG